VKKGKNCKTKILYKKMHIQLCGRGWTFFLSIIRLLWYIYYFRWKTTLYDAVLF